MKPTWFNSNVDESRSFAIPIFIWNFNFELVNTSNIKLWRKEEKWWQVKPGKAIEQNYIRISGGSLIAAFAILNDKILLH